MSEPYPPSSPPPPTDPAGPPLPYAQLYAPADPQGYSPDYASAAGGLPTSVMVIAIIGIVLASLALLRNVAGLAFVGFYTAGRMAFGPGYRVFYVANDVVFGAAAAVLLAASIGCLRRREWARRMLLAWAVAYSVLVLVSTVLVVAWVTPMVVAPMMARAATGPAVGPGVGPGVGFVAAMADVSACVGAAVCLILPVFVLVLMRRPTVRAAFASDPFASAAV